MARSTQQSPTILPLTTINDKMAQGFAADVNAIGTAVDSLLSSTKKSLSISDTGMGYGFYVSSSLTLDAHWTLFDGLVLNNVSLCKLSIGLIVTAWTPRKD